MSQEPVLVVDNEDTVRTAVAETVQSIGHPCHAAGDGHEALGLINGLTFDIIVSDIQLPGLNGLDLMEKARLIKPGIPFIIMAGRASDYPSERVIEAGANDFITKPFSGIEIKHKLERIFRELQLTTENRRLLEEQMVLNRKLSTILQMSRDLTAELNFDRVLERIADKVTEVMEAERTSLYLIDWERQEIWTKVAQDIDPIRLPIGDGISGRVALSGETINVRNAYFLPYFKWHFDLKHNFRTRSVLCMPVYNRRKERIAVLQVLNKRNGQVFNEHDEIILAAVASQVSIALENSFLLDELQLSFESSIRTLSATVDARHPLTAGHSQRVTEYSLLIAREMGLERDELEVIKYAALLHDIGKIGIRDEILLKKGVFSPDERDEMSSHALSTRKILENFHFPKYLDGVAIIASQHHEKVSGEGYPEGLTGEELSLGSKILAVADVFDALTSSRDYRKYSRDETFDSGPMPLSKVIEILQDDSGTHFDPEVVDAFLKCLPQALQLFRGAHFSPEYIEEAIQWLGGNIE